MGKFDKKATKQEPDAPKNMITFKKKSNSKLFALESSKSVEKDRNLGILNQMQREQDYAKAGKDTSKARMNTDKMIKKAQTKRQKA